MVIKPLLSARLIKDFSPEDTNIIFTDKEELMTRKNGRYSIGIKDANTEEVIVYRIDTASANKLT